MGALDFGFSCIRHFPGMDVEEEALYDCEAGKI